MTVRPNYRVEAVMPVIQTAPFPAVGLVLKHEGGSQGNAMGPVFYESVDGETSPYALDPSVKQTTSDRPATAWLGEKQARKIAKELNLPFEVF